MCDASIRRLTIAEEAQAAAQRFVQTGEAEENPHQGTGNEMAWRAAFERYLQACSAPEAEGNC